MGWDYYDHWDERQKRLKYELNKQIENTDIGKFIDNMKKKENVQKIRRKKNAGGKSRASQREKALEKQTNKINTI